MTQVEGYVEPGFEGVRDAFAANFEQHGEVGAGFALHVGGKKVVDIWGGIADVTTGKPYSEDALQLVFSTTKGATAMCALLLHERGQLDLDAPVAQYWPEFAQGGKEDVLVRHLLSHTAGLPAFVPPLAGADLYDWDVAVANLAAQTPMWEPGTASGYHALTQGQLVGEVVRRITGASLGQTFAKEIAGPLDADFHIGTEPVHFDRISNVIAPPDHTLAAGMTEMNEVQRAMVESTPEMTARSSWEEPWRRAEFPAGNGHGNARSVAKIQAVVSNGGSAGGVQLFSTSPEATIFREQCNGEDLVLGMPLRHGIGYGLPNELIPFPSQRTCFWGGWGGSLVLNDFENRMTIAYVMNKMGEGTVGDFRAGAIIAAAYGALLS